MLGVLLLFAILLFAQTPGEPENMVLVPGGEFVMGSNEANADESPAHRVHVSAFYIDVHEVTTSAFARFVRESGAADRLEGVWYRYSVEGCLDLIRHYERRYGGPLAEFQPMRASGKHLRRRLQDQARWRAAHAALAQMRKNAKPDVELIANQARLPVRGVTWRDARAFARWAGKRLPTEAEWEKAARGTDGRIYPWGSRWDPSRCRAGLGDTGGPAPVGNYPEGASPYGALDMAGNLWEYVEDWYGETYYGSSPARDPQGPEGLPDGRLPEPSLDINLLRSPRQGRESNTRKVIRGGGFGGPPAQARYNTRTSRRLWSNPNYWHPDVGFRCAKDAP